MFCIRRSYATCTAAALCGALLAAAAPAANDRESRDGLPRFVARMSPTQEVPPISSPARGSFSAVIDEAARTIRYELSYEGFESPVVQAHLHAAQPGVNGGIMVWLCGTPALPGPPGTPECPAGPGTIQGELTSDQIVGPTAQGISPGEFDEVIRAIRNGIVYANVHTTQHPSGEIRGQLRRGMTPAPGGAAASGADGGEGESAPATVPQPVPPSAPFSSVLRTI